MSVFRFPLRRTHTAAQPRTGTSIVALLAVSVSAACIAASACWIVFAQSTPPQLVAQRDPQPENLRHAKGATENEQSHSEQSVATEITQGQLDAAPSSANVTHGRPESEQVGAVGSPHREPNSRDRDAKKPQKHLSKSRRGAENEPLENQLHEAKLAEIDARVQLVEIGRQRIHHEVDQARKMARAELRLKLAQLDDEMYEQGEALRQRTMLQDEVALATERREQTAKQFEWSERLANKGYISQHVLELDQAAADAAGLKLKAAKNRLQVFQSHTHQRLTIESDATVASAQMEWKFLREVAQAQQDELTAKQLQAQRSHVSAMRSIEGLVSLQTESSGDGVPVPVVPALAAELERQKMSSKIAHAVFQRVHTKALADQYRYQGNVEQSRSQLLASRAELEEWLHGKASEKRHQKLIQVRTVAAELDTAQQKKEWSQRVVLKGYITPAEVDADQLQVKEKQAALRQAEFDLKIFDEYSQRRKQTELRANVAEAEREISRQERLEKAVEEETGKIVSARRQAWQLEADRLDVMEQGTLGS